MTEPLIKVPDVQFERAKLMLDRARWAASRMQKLDRGATRRIIDAVAAAGHSKAQAYAEWAVRETGMGVVEHKRIKIYSCDSTAGQALVPESNKVDHAARARIRHQRQPVGDRVLPRRMR